MATKEQEKEAKEIVGRIERGETYMFVPHNGREIALVHPLHGPIDYRTLGKQILGKGQDVPTGDVTASFLHEVYNSKSKEFKKSPEAENVRGIMKDDYLYVFNTLLWTPRDAEKAGVYVQNDPEALGLSKKMDPGELEDKLSGGTTEMGVRFSKDRTLRFAPYETIILGEQSPNSLAREGSTIATYDIEGAEKLSKVAAQFRYKPRVFGVTDNQESVQRVAGLFSYWYLVGCRLNVDGDCVGGDWGGFAAGVQKKAPKALRKNK